MDLAKAVEQTGDLLKAYDARHAASSNSGLVTLADLADVARAVQDLGEAMLEKLSVLPTVTITKPDACAIEADSPGPGVKPAHDLNDENGVPAEQAFEEIAAAWAITAPTDDELLALLHVLESLIDQAPALRKRGLPGYLTEACEAILLRAAELTGDAEVDDLPECPPAEQPESRPETDQLDRLCEMQRLCGLGSLPLRDCFTRAVEWVMKLEDDIEALKQSSAPTAGSQPESRVMRSSAGEEWWITPKGESVQCIWAKRADNWVQRYELKGERASEGWTVEMGAFAELVADGQLVPIDELEARVLIFEAQAKRAESELEEYRASYEATEKDLQTSRANQTELVDRLRAAVANVSELRGLVEGVKKELSTALDTVTQLQTNLRLSQANEKELEKAATEYAEMRRETRHALDAQRAKEAERVAAIEAGVAALARGYWMKMACVMEAAQSYSSKGRLGRFRTPFPYDDMVGTIGWDEADHASPFAAEQAATKGVIGQPAADPEPDEPPGKQPAVHAV